MSKSKCGWPECGEVGETDNLCARHGQRVRRFLHKQPTLSYYNPKGSTLRRQMKRALPEAVADWNQRHGLSTPAPIPSPPAGAPSGIPVVQLPATTRQPRTCIWPVCPERSNSRGLCKLHWARAKRGARRLSLSWPLSPEHLGRVVAEWNLNYGPKKSSFPLPAFPEVPPELQQGAGRMARGDKDAEAPIPVYYPLLTSESPEVPGLPERGMNTDRLVRAGSSNDVAAEKPAGAPPVTAAQWEKVQWTSAHEPAGSTLDAVIADMIQAKQKWLTETYADEQLCQGTPDGAPDERVYTLTQISNAVLRGLARAMPDMKLDVALDVLDDVEAALLTKLRSKP